MLVDVGRMDKMTDLKELNKLETYLKLHNIKYERYDNEFMSGESIYVERHQICVPSMEDKQWDVICQAGSFGHDRGLLEIMGTLVDESVDDVVEGWLTAHDIISRLESGDNK